MVKLQTIPVRMDISPVSYNTKNLSFEKMSIILINTNSVSSKNKEVWSTQRNPKTPIIIVIIILRLQINLHNKYKILPKLSFVWILLSKSGHIGQSVGSRFGINKSFTITNAFLWKWSIIHWLTPELGYQICMAFLYLVTQIR